MPSPRLEDFNELHTLRQDRLELQAVRQRIASGTGLLTISVGGPVREATGRRILNDFAIDVRVSDVGAAVLSAVDAAITRNTTRLTFYGVDLTPTPT